MAEAKKRRIRKIETVREKTEKATKTAPKPRRVRRTASVAAKPFKAAHRVGRKEFYLPMPDTRLGRFLNKRRSLTPRFLKDAWNELRQVTWPSNKETLKLTFAVMMFALVFGGLIWVTDYGLENLFRKVLID